MVPDLTELLSRITGRTVTTEELAALEAQSVSEPSDVATTEESPAAALSTLHVALLYKRQAQPDEEVLTLLETQLRALGYEVFIDRHLTVGMEWAREIEQRIRSA